MRESKYLTVLTDFKQSTECKFITIEISATSSAT